MPDELKPQVELEPEPQVGSVEVDLEAKPITEVSKENELVKKLESSISLKYDKVLKNLENQLAGARRIIERQEAQLKAPPQPVQPVEQAPKVYADDLDKMKNEDPWKAVEFLAEQKAQKIIQEMEAKEELDRIQNENLRLKESNIAEVIQHYPDLHPEQGNPDSDVSRVYADVLNKNPRFIHDPYGPVLAEREMEKEFLRQGIDIFKQKRQVYATSKQPAKRSGLDTSLPPGRTSSDTKYTLTPDEKAMCETYGIPFEDYAKVAKALETSGGEVTT